MEFAIVFALGAVFGAILALTTSYSRSVGNLRIDRSDPEEPPYLFLELIKDVGDISRKKYVLLRVNVKDFISRK